ncbi:hypothetical protein CerSpe_238100 [Prunus speciosa]
MAVAKGSLHQNHHQPNPAFQYLFQALDPISLIVSQNPKQDQEPVTCGSSHSATSWGEDPDTKPPWS